MSSPLVCVVGDLLEDVVVRPHGEIRTGTDTDADVLRRQGGSGANVAREVVARGGRARLACRIGADALGDRLVADLVARGVEVCAQRAGRTGSIVVLVDGAGERTMLRDRAGSGAVAPPPRWLDGAAALHVTLYGFEEPTGRATVLALAAQAHAAAARVSVDLSSVAVLDVLGRSTVSRLLEQAGPDVVFANEDEAAWLGPDRGPIAGAALLVVTRGARSTRIRRGDVVHDVPVAAVSGAPDTTGAGDAFRAGFLVARARGAEPVAAAVAGHEAAACRLRRQR